MTKEVADVIEELKKVGALIPEPELTKCLDAHSYLLDGVLEARTLAHALMFSPSESIKNWDIARIDGQRQLVNSLSGQGYIPKRDAGIMQTNLQDAISAIKASDWIVATDRLQRYSMQIEEALPVWHEDCACVKKGDIIASVQHSISEQSDIGISPTNKNILWQDTIAALNRRGILTSDEASRLIKEVRW